MHSKTARFVFVLMLSVVLAAGVFGGGATGFGKKVSAAPITAIQAWDRSMVLSVRNKGTSDIFVLVNITTNSFNTRYSAGTTLPIAAGDWFTFEASDNRGIGSVCYRTASGTNDSVYLGSF